MLFYCHCKIDTLAPLHSELFSSFQGQEGSGLVRQYVLNYILIIVLRCLKTFYLQTKGLPKKRPSERDLKPLEVSQKQKKIAFFLFITEILRQCFAFTGYAKKYIIYNEVFATITVI